MRLKEIIYYDVVVHRLFFMTRVYVFQLSSKMVYQNRKKLSYLKYVSEIIEELKITFLLIDDYGDREVKQKLVEAFESVSKGFVEDLINGPLMEKMSLEDQMPEVYKLNTLR